MNEVFNKIKFEQYNRLLDGWQLLKKLNTVLFDLTKTNLDNELFEDYLKQIFHEIEILDDPIQLK